MEEQSNEALWYVVHTYSGYENKVATDLQTMVENRRLQDLICDIKVPTEMVPEIKDGKERKPKENHKISLRIDLENSIKAQQSAGYEKWAKLHNLKQAARTLNFLTEHEIDSYPDLESRVAEITAASTEAAAALKAAERRLAEMAVLIKDVTTCKELRPLLQEYQRAADKKQFRRKHEGTLILYEAAAKALKEQGFQKLPDLYALKNEYKQLAEQKDQMQRQYNDAKRQMQEYGIIKQNVDGILRTTPGKEQMQER